tara:strand:- start:43 stop:186 length:144 start_codon:yes stop_codon:yes gene_type:complete
LRERLLRGIERIGVQCLVGIYIERERTLNVNNVPREREIEREVVERY